MNKKDKDALMEELNKLLGRMEFLLSKVDKELEAKHGAGGGLGKEDDWPKMEGGSVAIDNGFTGV